MADSGRQSCSSLREEHRGGRARSYRRRGEKSRATLGDEDRLRRDAERERVCFPGSCWRDGQDSVNLTTGGCPPRECARPRFHPPPTYLRPTRAPTRVQEPGARGRDDHRRPDRPRIARIDWRTRPGGATGAASQAAGPDEPAGAGRPGGDTGLPARFEGFADFVGRLVMLFEGGQNETLARGPILASGRSPSWSRRWGSSRRSRRVSDFST
jgi:hypothetical protein